MVQLIAAPDVYSGKTVAVIGYLSVNELGAMLFYDERSFQIADANTAVRLRFEDKSDMASKTAGLIRGYYRVIGRFDASLEHHKHVNNPYLVTRGVLSKINDIQVSSMPWGFEPVTGQKSGDEKLFEKYHESD